LELPISYIRPIFEAYVRGYTPKIWPYMVQYLHFRILKFPLNLGSRLFIFAGVVVVGGWLKIPQPLSGHLLSSHRKMGIEPTIVVPSGKIAIENGHL